MIEAGLLPQRSESLAGSTIKRLNEYEVMDKVRGVNKA